MEIFKLKESEEYIELNNLLKIFNWVASGGEGKMMIRQNEVSVNGEVETRIRRKMRSGDLVKLGDKEGKVA